MVSDSTLGLQFLLSCLIFLGPSIGLALLQKSVRFCQKSISKKILRYNLSVTLGGFLGLFVNFLLPEFLKDPDFITSRLFIFAFLVTFLLVFSFEQLNSRSKKMNSIVIGLAVHRLSESMTFASIFRGSSSHFLLLATILFSEVIHTVSDFFSLLTLSESSSESFKVLFVLGAVGVFGMTLESLLGENIRRFLNIISMVVFLNIVFGELKEEVFETEDDEVSSKGNTKKFRLFSPQNVNFLATLTFISVGFFITCLFE